MKIDGGREKNRQLREREGLSNAPPFCRHGSREKKETPLFLRLHYIETGDDDATAPTCAVDTCVA